MDYTAQVTFSNSIRVLEIGFSDELLEYMCDGEQGAENARQHISTLCVMEQLDVTESELNGDITLNIPSKNMQLLIPRTDQESPIDDEDQIDIDGTDMDEELKGSSTKEVKNWSKDQTKFLLSLYAEKFPKVGKTVALKTKKKMWLAIAAAMKEKGYDFTAIQVENRYKTLDRNYKAKIKNNKKTGRSRAFVEFNRELDEINSGKKTIFPDFLLGSTGEGITCEQLKENAGLKISSSEPSSSPTVSNGCPSPFTSEPLPLTSPEVDASTSTYAKKKSRSAVEEVKTLAKQYTEELAVREKELEMEKRMLDAYEERTAVLKRKNDMVERYLRVQEKQLGLTD